MIRQAPELDAIGYRVGESGKGESFFRCYQEAVKAGGKDIPLFTRTWLTRKAQVLPLARASDDYSAEIKYNGEQWGPPYFVAGGRMAGWYSYSFEDYLSYSGSEPAAHTWPGNPIPQDGPGRPNLTKRSGKSGATAPTASSLFTSLIGSGAPSRPCDWEPLPASPSSRSTPFTQTLQDIMSRTRRTFIPGGFSTAMNRTSCFGAGTDTTPKPRRRRWIYGSRMPSGTGAGGRQGLEDRQQNHPHRVYVIQPGTGPTRS